MANADTRSGFRLPWSSDRAHDGSSSEPSLEAAPSLEAPPSDDLAWPESDFAARLGLTPTAARPADEAPGVAAEADEPEEDEPQVFASAPEPAPVRKPSKLMVDLVAAIRATTGAARDGALAAVEADATAVVEAIRSGSTSEAAAIHRRSDADLVAIRDWSKAEIARIREEAESRIGARKSALATELAAHSTAVEQRVGEVEAAVSRYRAAMDAYVENLAREEDPSRLATMAEAMPEPPTLAAWAELDNLEIATAHAGASVDADPVDADVAEAEAVDVEVVAIAEAEVEAADAADAAEAEVEAADVETARAWSEPGSSWGTDDSAPAATTSFEASDTDGDAGDDVPRWTAGETPDGFPAHAEGGDPVDRGAIMAALEAAAEAVVAAESAAESADQAEAAADVAETAAELLVSRSGQDEDDPEAQAALSARVDAGGFDTESFTDRLASLMPGHGDGPADGEPRTTQVVVTGLVSVASIASFKRHLGRLAGVTSVGVASGPDGEFVFNVGHRPDVSFRDALPTLPGFAARVTGSGDGVVSVTARDPETEG